MFPTKAPKWALIGLAALLLLGIGSALYNSGWSQGFMLGLLTGNSDGADITPYLVSRTHGWQGGFGGAVFGFFGFVFRLIFFVFLFGLLMKFLGCRRRHSWQGGPGWQGWQDRHGERVEGHFGPWWNQPYQQPNQPASGPQAQQSAPPGGETEGNDRPQPTSWTRL